MYVCFFVSFTHSSHITFWFLGLNYFPQSREVSFLRFIFIIVNYMYVCMPLCRFVNVRPEKVVDLLELELGSCELPNVDAGDWGGFSVKAEWTTNPSSSNYVSFKEISKVPVPLLSWSFVPFVSSSKWEGRERRRQLRRPGGKYSELYQIFPVPSIALLFPWWWGNTCAPKSFSGVHSLRSNLL